MTDKLEFPQLLEQVESYHDGHINSMSFLIDEALTKVVRRALETGKASSLSVTLNFTRYDDCRVAITGDLKTKLPEGKKQARTFYYDRNGELSLEDTTQPKMFDRDGNVATPLKRVS
jgi:hypothetical protein